MARLELRLTRALYNRHVDRLRTVRSVAVAGALAGACAVAACGGGKSTDGSTSAAGTSTASNASAAFAPARGRTIQDLRREFPEAAIIAMSGRDSRMKFDVFNVARELGAVRTFKKPFRFEELVAAVRQVGH